MSNKSFVNNLCTILNYVVIVEINLVFAKDKDSIVMLLDIWALT